MSEIKVSTAILKSATENAADHLPDKIAVYFIYILIGVVSVELSNPYIALVLVTAVWPFGINSVACCVETVRGRGHRHKLI